MNTFNTPPKKPIKPITTTIPQNTIPFKLWRKCQDSQALIYASEDFKLRWHERFSLKSHLMVCKACDNVQSNVSVLRGMLGKWRSDE
jgi:hypothetical protein